MKNLLLILSTLLLLAACSKKTTAKVSDAATKPDKAVAIADPPFSEPKVTAIEAVPKTVGIPKDVDPNLRASLHRSPCFGRCPSFSYELFADGRVVYHGYSHTPRIGNFNTKVDDGFMKRVAAKALSIKYLELSDHYPTADIAVSDVPTTTTYIRIGDAGKKITNNYDPPKELREFEQWLETQFDALNWQAAKE
jgi:hypothetical protein